LRFGKEASQTRGYCGAQNAPQRPPYHAKTGARWGPRVRAARPDPSLRKKRLLGMTIKLHHYQNLPQVLSYLREIVLFELQVP